jgi:mannose-6-phosphate isomerase class I
VVTAFLDKVYVQMEEEENPFAMPAPLTSNAYAQVKRYQNHNSEPECSGFTADKTFQKYVNDMFRGGWTASEKNAAIVFQVEGTEIAVQYRKSVLLPAPVAVAVVDDDEEHGVELDANFDETWGDCLYITTLAHHIENGLHKVEIRLKETHENDAVPFYLVSVISAHAEEKPPILFFEPVMKQMVWGGRRLGEEWGYEIPGENAGECWGISAHPHGDCKVKEGIYKGRTLSELWKNEPQLFGCPGGDRFPLLTKIIDSKDDLSIQVHPDDAYAKEHENGSLGKTECWYVLDCPEAATLVLGHNAKSKEELRSMIEGQRWGDFLREVPVKKGDFIQIEPGTVHALKGGILLLETQQNSDITYRVYDYDRKPGGVPRQLHIKQSIDVITVPAKEAKDSILDTAGLPDNAMNSLISCDYYQVWKLRITKPYVIPAQKGYLLLSVVAGEGEINGRHIRKGDHFLLPVGYGEAALQGDMEIIISAPAEA